MVARIEDTRMECRRGRTYLRSGNLAETELELQDLLTEFGHRSGVGLLVLPVGQLLLVHLNLWGYSMFLLLKWSLLLKPLNGRHGR